MEYRVTQDKIWVVDIETLRNFHCLTALNAGTLERKVFVVHPRRDDRQEYFAWLKTNPVWVTFNGLAYDYPVVHRIIKFKDFFLKKTIDEVVNWLYTVSCKVIEQEYSQVAPEETYLRQYDLYRIWHYNNKARRTSLKMLEFNLRWLNVMDMPHSPHDCVTNEDIEKILDYNLNDVLATHEFWKVTVDQGRIELRDTLSEQYNIDLTSADDIKIGTELFAMMIAKEHDIPLYHLKKLRTKRYKIKLEDCILPYISFDSKEFGDLLEFLKGQTIINTKGIFDDLSVEYNGLTYHYGTGGIHACIEAGAYHSDDEWAIIDVDVSSFYPNISIQNDIRPAHLGETFNKQYSLAYQTRKKIPKSDPLNTAYKLLLNGVFGKSNDRHSFLYDRAVLLSITLNGQLLLSKLIEMVTRGISDVTVLQANTDGATFRIRREYYDTLITICKQWESFTKLELEYANYKSMFIRDVNNYIGVYEKGTVKLKGAFEVDRDYHKNGSQRIVALAAIRELIYGVKCSDTIRNHLNHEDYNDVYTKLNDNNQPVPLKNYKHFDFFEVVRVKKSDQKGHASLLMKQVVNKQVIETPLQKVNRFYCSLHGGRLIKQYEDGSSQHIRAGKVLTTVCNMADQPSLLAMESNIDYHYYIAQAEKLVHSIIPAPKYEVLTLF